MKKLLVVALAGLYFGRSEKPQPSVEAPALGAAAGETPTTGAETGLVLVATPWARVLEITDAAGYEHPLPDDATTPLFVAVPPGTYRVVFSFDELDAPADRPATDEDGTIEDGESAGLCRVEVPEGGVGHCNERLRTVDARALLKDSGWWR